MSAEHLIESEQIFWWLKGRVSYTTSTTSRVIWWNWKETGVTVSIFSTFSAKIPFITAYATKQSFSMNKSL